MESYNPYACFDIPEDMDGPPSPDLEQFSQGRPAFHNYSVDQWLAGSSTAPNIAAGLPGGPLCRPPLPQQGSENVNPNHTAATHQYGNAGLGISAGQPIPGPSSSDPQASQLNLVINPAPQPHPLTGTAVGETQQHSDTDGTIPIVLDPTLGRGTNIRDYGIVQTPAMTAGLMVAAIRAGHFTGTEARFIIDNTDPLPQRTRTQLSAAINEPRMMSENRRKAYYDDFIAIEQDVSAINSGIAPSTSLIGRLHVRRFPDVFDCNTIVCVQQESNHEFDKLFCSNVPLVEGYDNAIGQFRAFNPDFFQMPRGSRVVNIKIDSLENMIRGIRYGVWTNQAKVNARIMEVWEEMQKTNLGEKPEPTLYFLFSVSGSKQYCALAEMLGPVDTSKSIGGWKKSDCAGITPLRFIFVKNVPFSVFADLNNGHNEQSVLNMWNGMVFERGVDRTVVERYAIHSFCRNILIYPPLEGPCPHYPSSPNGKFQYNRASGLGSHHQFLRMVKSSLRTGQHWQGEPSSSGSPEQVKVAKPVSYYDERDYVFSSNLSKAQPIAPVAPAAPAAPVTPEKQVITVPSDQQDDLRQSPESVAITPRRQRILQACSELAAEYRAATYQRHGGQSSIPATQTISYDPSSFVSNAMHAGSHLPAHRSNVPFEDPFSGDPPPRYSTAITMHGHYDYTQANMYSGGCRNPNSVAARPPVPAPPEPLLDEYGEPVEGYVPFEEQMTSAPWPAPAPAAWQTVAYRVLGNDGLVRDLPPVASPHRVYRDTFVDARQVWELPQAVEPQHPGVEPSSSRVNEPTQPALTARAQGKQPVLPDHRREVSANSFTSFDPIHHAKAYKMFPVKPKADQDTMKISVQHDTDRHSQEVGVTAAPRPRVRSAMVAEIEGLSMADQKMYYQMMLDKIEIEEKLAALLAKAASSSSAH